MTRKPALIVMAAGSGSRYGGLKQMDPVGPRGELIIDYSVYDAVRAGFGKIVFVIRKDFEEAFREKIGHRIEGVIDTEYVFQSLEDLPRGHEKVSGREKPWGTGHAVLSCRPVVTSPFAVINADDYYGASSFRVLYEYLDRAGEQGSTGHYCMVGFQLEKTLTENGPVARGVCSLGADGCLREIRERTRIQSFSDGVRYTENGTDWVAIPGGSIVSMNAWGFTPDIFQVLEAGFRRFLRENRERILKAEYYLPSVAGNLVSEGKGSVKVLVSGEKWYGMTYPGDKPGVRQAIGDLIRQGKYPEGLWRNLDEPAAL